MPDLIHPEGSIITNPTQWIVDALYDLKCKVGTLISNQGKLMSALSDYAAKVDAFAANVASAADAIKTAIAALQAQIAAGTVSSSDQAALDKSLADLGAAAAKIDAIAAPPAPPAP